MAADGSIIIDTRIDNSGAAKDLQEFERKVGAAAKASVVAMGALSAAVVKVGSDFESSVAKASTLFGGVKVDTAGLNDQILELSSSSGVAASAIGNSLYNALSAGIPVTEDMGSAMKYMEQSTKLAKAGFTDVDTVVTSTAKVLNAYKMDVSETDKVHKVLMQTQNKGITTVGELGASLAQVTPTASAMNVAFEQVGASLATMTAQGTPTAQATTQLNQLFAELGKKGTAAQKGLEEATNGTKYAGKSFQDLMAAGVPLNEVLDLMNAYAKKNNKSLLDMFGSIEAGKAALAMSGQNAKQFSDNLAAMGTNADVVEDAYTKVTDTLQEQTKQAVETTKNLGIKIYKNMEGPLKDIVKEANEGMKKVAKALDTPAAKAAIKGLVDGFLSIIKVVKNVVTNVGGPLLKVLGSLAKDGKKAADIVQLGVAAFIAYKTAVNVAKGVQMAYEIQAKLTAIAQQTLNTAMSATPAGLLAGAIGAVVTGLGFLLISTEDQTEASNELTDKIKAQREAMKELEEQREEKIDSDLVEIDQAERMLARLDSLVDANGKVVGSKEEVKRITDEINEIVPDSIKWIDDETISYTENAQAIKDKLKQKKALMILEAYEPEYKAALKRVNEDLLLQAQAEEDYAKAKIEYDKAHLEYLKDEGDIGTYDVWQEKKKNMEEASQNLTDIRQQVKSDYSLISTYEREQLGVEQGNMESIRGICETNGANLQGLTDVSVESLKERLEKSQARYEQLQKMYADGEAGITKELVDAAKENVDSCTDALLIETMNQAPYVQQSGKYLAQTYGDGISSQTPEIRGSMEDLMDVSTKALVDKINSSSSYVKGAAKLIPDSVVDGMEEGEQSVAEGAGFLANAAYKGLDYEAAKKDWNGVGGYIASGVKAGIEAKTAEVARSMFDFANSIFAATKRAFEIKSPSRKAKREIGIPFIQGVEGGVESEKKTLSKKSREAILAAYNAMRSTVIGETMRIGMTMSGTYNINREIEHMVVQQPAAQTGAQINQTNNFYSPEPISPGEAARQQRNANRLLLLQMQK